MAVHSLAYLLIVLVLFAGLYTWAALRTSSLALFVPEVSVRTQLAGPPTAVHAAAIAAMAGLPGVRLLERRHDDALFSVLPTPTSMDRAYGAFVLIAIQEGAVVLLGRRRLPLPAPKLAATLHQLERDIRNRLDPWKGDQNAPRVFGHALLVGLAASVIGTTACSSEPLAISCKEYLQKSQQEQLDLAALWGSPNQKTTGPEGRIVAPSYRENFLTYCPKHPDDQLKDLYPRFGIGG
ncbi:MAG TPA: hypothetical protein VIY28_00385 [Pseudonocardiaceae bacterium]